MNPSENSGTPKDDVGIAQAAPGDTPIIKDLLASCGLPTEDLPASLENFFVLRRGSAVIGCVGLEIYGQTCILRSLAVRPGERGSGFGALLVSRALAAARSLGQSEVWLLTQTAAKFFERLGFNDADRDAAPPAIRGSRQFRRICPSTAACMKISLH